MTPLVSNCGDRYITQAWRNLLLLQNCRGDRRVIFTVEERRLIRGSCSCRIVTLDTARRDKTLLSGKPLHVPLAGSLDVLYQNLKRVKIEGSDGIESHVKEDQGPFEEGVCRVS